MRVLIACEFSGVVREAFTKRGHDAWSCDLLPSLIDGNHLQCDVLTVLDMRWELMIAHPPCDNLAVSGARYFEQKRKDGRQQRSIDFFMKLANAPIEKIALENPISIMSTVWRKPDQIIQPYQFGHPTTKPTCLWLKNLPKLVPTNIVDRGERVYYKNGKSAPVWHNQTGKGDGLKRSITFQGFADAFADQWTI